MRITFAYPRTVGETEYAPNDTADINDPVAKDLVREGFARPASDTSKARAQTMTKGSAVGGREGKGTD